MASKCLLNLLNAIYFTLGLGLTVASIWFFVEVKLITDLRNSNHYLLDYKVYWPQAVPWLFFIVGVISVIVASVGFAAVRKRSGGLMKGFSVSLGITILLLIAAGVIALIFANNKATDEFIKDTIWDAYFQAKGDQEVLTSFGTIEKRLHCCGSDGPRDYKNWKNEFPTSCCDTYYHGWIGSYVIDCDFTNKLANERHGCSTVAIQYARIVICVLSAVAIFIALIGCFSLCSSVALTRSMNKKPRGTPSEADSKKVLL